MKFGPITIETETKDQRFGILKGLAILFGVPFYARILAFCAPWSWTTYLIILSVILGVIGMIYGIMSLVNWASRGK